MNPRIPEIRTFHGAGFLAVWWFLANFNNFEICDVAPLRRTCAKQCANGRFYELEAACTRSLRPAVYVPQAFRQHASFLRQPFVYRFQFTIVNVLNHHVSADRHAAHLAHWWVVFNTQRPERGRLNSDAQTSFPDVPARALANFCERERNTKVILPRYASS